MALADVNPGGSVAELSREKRLALLRLTTAFPLEIEALGDFHVAMVTCGGVPLAEVNSKTMESRLVKELYFLAKYWISTGTAEDTTCRPPGPPPRWQPMR
jgi:predicted flavoprotein YhiN